ncbi:hypothetical protein R3P38DRAFT_2764920 [Favolaschia claudopus]|uniref:Uncharacterized protein n=1 Tax=Favolaschia claudopus TaxID=2862362 RepID=A0AAW0D9F8_9AGAR
MPHARGLRLRFRFFARLREVAVFADPAALSAHLRRISTRDPPAQRPSETKKDDGGRRQGVKNFLFWTLALNCQTLFGGACARLALSRHLRNFSIGSLHSGTLANPAAASRAVKASSGVTRVSRRRLFLVLLDSRDGLPPIPTKLNRDVVRRSKIVIAQLKSPSLRIGFALNILEEVDEMFSNLDHRAFNSTGILYLARYIKIGGTCAVRVNDTARLFITTTTPTSLSPTFRPLPPLFVSPRQRQPPSFILRPPIPCLQLLFFTLDRRISVFELASHPQADLADNDFIGLHLHGADSNSTSRRLRHRRSNSRLHIQLNILEYANAHQAHDACAASLAKASKFFRYIFGRRQASTRPFISNHQIDLRSWKTSATEWRVAAQTFNCIHQRYASGDVRTRYKPPAGNFRVLDVKTAGLYFNLDDSRRRFQAAGRLAPRLHVKGLGGSAAQRRGIDVLRAERMISFFFTGSGRREANPTPDIPPIEFPNNSKGVLSPLPPRRAAALTLHYLCFATRAAASHEFGLHFRLFKDCRPLNDDTMSELYCRKDYLNIESAATSADRQLLDRTSSRERLICSSSRERPRSLQEGSKSCSRITNTRHINFPRPTNVLQCFKILNSASKRRLSVKNRDDTTYRVPASGRLAVNPSSWPFNEF